MHVHWKFKSGRSLLTASLVQSKRQCGKVHNQTIVYLGGIKTSVLRWAASENEIDVLFSICSLEAFWQRIIQKEQSNYCVFGGVAKRVPTVTCNDVDNAKKSLEVLLRIYNRDLSPLRQNKFLKLRDLDLDPAYWDFIGVFQAKNGRVLDALRNSFADSNSP